MKTLIGFGTIILIFLSAQMIAAQTTAFNYQGKLTDAGTPQATYQMQFKLFDAAVGGTQIGGTIDNPSVAVSDGVFSVSLDFGSNAFTGASRFLEISVRRSASENYTILAPRQQIASSPYSIRTLSAQTSDVALDANKLGGVNASEYVTNATVGSSFIRNQTTQQTADFNITGNGFVGGKIGIGTTSPSARLTVSGSGLFNAPNAARFDLFNTVLGGGFLQHVLDNGTWQLATTGGATRMVVDSTGSVGLGTGSPSPFFRLDVVGHGGVRSLSNSASHFVAETTGGTNSWARVYMRSSNRSWFMGTSQAFNGDQFYLVDETANQTRMAIATNGNIGFGTTNPTAKLEVVGTTKTNILQITGGSDLAENFEIGDKNIKPGMIVAIDPANSGKLVLARGAYNRQVAGIISGANNLSAGMVLPDLKENENSLPVALSGRVWVYADATKRAINPGDLLTTSDTPGYAMKVTKYKKANGAIIGKAMTELKSGTGLVLVLVSLQ